MEGSHANNSVGLGAARTFAVWLAAQCSGGWHKLRLLRPPSPKGGDSG